MSEIFKSFCIISSERYSIIFLQCLSHLLQLFLNHIELIFVYHVTFNMIWFYFPYGQATVPDYYENKMCLPLPCTDCHPHRISRAPQAPACFSALCAGHQSFQFFLPMTTQPERRQEWDFVSVISVGPVPLSSKLLFSSSTPAIGGHCSSTQISQKASQLLINQWNGKIK